MKNYMKLFVNTVILTLKLKILMRNNLVTETIYVHKTG